MYAKLRHPTPELDMQKMNDEINRQIAVNTRKHESDIEALILWELHKQLGWGAKRLKRFFDNFGPSLDQLIDRYEMGYADGPWLVKEKLKEIGVDVDAWKEAEERKK